MEQVMHRSKYIVCGVLAAGIAVPIIIGASCPPPNDPAFVSIITGPGSTISQELPNCEPGRVCISILNQTCTDTDIILYIHDGYDLDGEFVTRTAIECCENDNATAPCPCFRPGSTTGEMQLTPPELFQPQNRFPIANGDVVFELQGRESQLSALGGRVTVSIRCEEVKNIGLEVGLAGALPGTVEERAGADYRCTMVNTDRGNENRVEDVACGATLQYTIVDRNNCANEDLTVFRIQTNVSADCSDVTPADGGTDGTGGTGGGGFGGAGFGGG
jgi:hypothetical protein